MSALNPEILKWARETAGLSLEDAARAIDLKEAHSVSGAERLAALEAGKDEPSRPLLLKMTRAYRRSLLVFYLEKPPKKGDRGEDFRTLPGGEPPLYNPALDALIRDIRGRQSIMRSLLLRGFRSREAAVHWFCNYQRPRERTRRAHYSRTQI